MTFARTGPGGIPAGTPNHPNCATARVFAFDGTSFVDTGETVEVANSRDGAVLPDRMTILEPAAGRWFIVSADD